MPAAPIDLRRSLSASALPAATEQPPATRPGGVSQGGRPEPGGPLSRLQSRQARSDTDLRGSAAGTSPQRVAVPTAPSLLASLPAPAVQTAQAAVTEFDGLVRAHGAQLAQAARTGFEGLHFPEHRDLGLQLAGTLGLVHVPPPDLSHLPERLSGPQMLGQLRQGIDHMQAIAAQIAPATMEGTLNGSRDTLKQMLAEAQQHASVLKNVLGTPRAPASAVRAHRQDIKDAMDGWTQASESLHTQVKQAFAKHDPRTGALDLTDPLIAQSSQIDRDAQQAKATMLSRMVMDRLGHGLWNSTVGAVFRTFSPVTQKVADSLGASPASRQA